MHIRAYAHIHAYTRICTHIHAYARIRMHIHEYACIYAHMHTYTHIHAYARISILGWVLHAYTRICTHIHAYARIYTHIHAYAHIHAYTRICSLLSLGPSLLSWVLIGKSVSVSFRVRVVRACVRSCVSVRGTMILYAGGNISRVVLLLLRPGLQSGVFATIHKGFKEILCI